jgi:hypothetical protein
MLTKKIISTGFCLGILILPQVFMEQLTVAFDALAWCIAVMVAAIISHLIISRFAHIILLLAIFSSLVFGVGLAEFGSIFLWLVSSWSVGILVLGKLYRTKDMTHISITEAVVLGAVIWLAVWGVMLHFAVNYQALHLVISLLPAFFLGGRITEIRIYLFSRIVISSKWIKSIPFGLWVAGLIVVSWVLRWASFPSMGFDDHANHLRMWTELLTTHRFSFDITNQIWSTAPFSVNLLHSALSLMAGNNARSAMNLGLAILLLLLLAGIARTWKLATWTQWLLMVLMASTPLLGNLLLHLQTELLLAVIALAGVRLVIDAQGGWRGRRVMGVLSCAALCASIKLPGAVLGTTLLLALTVRWWSQRETKSPTGLELSWPALLLLIPLSFVALHSYAIAWIITGNPVFPLYNAVFLSPFYDPINFSDSRWIHGFGLKSYVRVFFYTSEFFESGNYTAGWQYLIMLPLAMISLLRSGVPTKLRIILIPVLGFGLVMFSATQYWRYMFPVMPLAVLLLGALFIPEKPLLRNIACILAIACIAANLTFFTRVTWMMNSPSSTAFTRDGKETLMNLYAPAAVLTERVNNIGPGSRVLYSPSTPYGATLQGVPLYLNWYQPWNDKAFSSLEDTDGLGEFLSKEKVNFAIVIMSTTSNFRDNLLREYMSLYGYVEGQANNFLLYRIGGDPVQYRKLFELFSSEDKIFENANLLMPKTNEGVTATLEGKILTVIPNLRARQARYKVEFSCPTNSGYFVAQVNWDKGAPYYRLVDCEARTVKFSEAIPIPFGATQGSIYLTSRDTPNLQVKNISLEVN